MNLEWIFHVPVIFTCDDSGYSQSCGTHIGQAVYLQIADSYKVKQVIMAIIFFKVCWVDGAFVSNRAEQSKPDFLQSLIATDSRR